MASIEEMEAEVIHEPENEPTDDLGAKFADTEAYFNYYNAQTSKNLDKVNDIQEKLLVAFNIVQSCKTGITNEQKESQINKLHQLTGQPLQYLEELVKDEKYVERSLKQAIIDTKPLPPSTTQSIYSDIRDIFIDFYVKKKQIPTTTDFLASLQIKNDYIFYKNAKIRTLVKNNLVKYHHIPKLNRYIICENPVFAYKRHLYLKQIIGYRTRGTNIIYVTVLKAQIGEKKYFLVIAASSTGLIVKSNSINYTGAYDDENGSEQVKLWIRHELLPHLSSNAVIVLMQPKMKDATPTPYSTKIYMVNWLQKRNIPCDMETHKAKLYSLVKLFKKNKEEGYYEEILASAGFIVLLCPIEYKNINFYEYLETSSNSNVYQLMTKLSKLEWSMIERRVMEEEAQMMADDEEMGRIVENLFQMVKNGDLKKEDFPDGCTGTKADNFAVHVGDIIVD